MKINVHKNSISDHYGLEIYQTIQQSKLKATVIYKRKYLSTALSAKLNQLLSRQSWDAVRSADDVETKYNIFHDLLVNCIDKIIPVTKCTLQSEKKDIIPEDYITLGLKDEIKLYEELLHLNPRDASFLKN